MAVPDLPREILIDIFTRIPVKTVGRCRCISKIWRDLLSSPQFIKSHLTRQGHKKNVILISSSRSVHFIEDFPISRKLESPDNCVGVAGSYDGLVLLQDKEDVKFLVNPITQQQIQVTDSPLALTKGESFSMYGFGFDRINDDYKIVALSYWDTDNEYNSDCADTFVDVYSVKRGVWRRAQNSPYDHAVPHLSCGAFLHGAIHWLASSREDGYRSVIAAFSLADEVFDEMPPPSGVDLEKFVFWKLVVFEGCLCMIDSRSSWLTNVWIMREYGVGESWTKLAIATNYEFGIIKPLYFVGDEEVAVLDDEANLVVYNTRSWTSRDIIVDGVPLPHMFIDADIFVESLVSPAFTLHEATR